MTNVNTKKGEYQNICNKYQVKKGIYMIVFKNNTDSEFFVKISANSIEVISKDELLAILNNSKDDSSINNSNSATVQSDEPTFNELLLNDEITRDFSYNKLKAIKSAFFSILSKDEQNTRISDLNLYKNISNLINRQDLKEKTKKYYISAFKSFLNHLHTCMFISFNPLQNYVIPKFKNDSTNQPALNCEYFLSDLDAKKAIVDFMQQIYISQKIEIYKLWIVQFIVATRPQETIRLINNYNPNNDFVIIDTKCKSNFSIPITPELKKIILELKPFITKYEDILHLLRRSIPNTYKGKISLHGTRAIFRTSIELLNTSFTFDEKEAYICHFNTTHTQKAYLRTDFYKARKEIQDYWLKWIFSATSSIYRL